MVSVHITKLAVLLVKKLELQSVWTLLSGQCSDQQTGSITSERLELQSVLTLSSGQCSHQQTGSITSEKLEL